MSRGIEAVGAPVRAAAGLGLRAVAGDAPVRYLRRIDRYAHELLTLLRTTQTDVASLAETADTLSAQMAKLEEQVARLQAQTDGMDRNLAAVARNVDEIRRDIPGEDDTGPVERVKRAVTG
jgi:septal ring factor EnvC (AmiA/AmiB activator)